METSYVKEVKRNFRGNLLNYTVFLKKRKVDQPKVQLPSIR